MRGVSGDVRAGPDGAVAEDVLEGVPEAATQPARPAAAPGRPRGRAAALHKGARENVPLGPTRVGVAPLDSGLNCG